MLPFSFDEIDEAALRSLIENQVAERRDLEYKRDLPGRGDDEVKELLADVTSLANAQGGDLIFGIHEADGVAAELVGIASDDHDAEILRLESSLRDNVAPRLIGLRTRWVPLPGGRGAIVMRVPGSLNAPHQIVFKKTRRFWGRSGKGKYEMDVHELRHAFTKSEQLPQRFRQIHDDAIKMARGEDMPFAIDALPKAVISVAPLGLFREERRIPVERDHAVVPIRHGGYSAIDTIEGVLIHGAASRETGAVSSFALTHRSGRVDSIFLIGAPRDGHHAGQELKYVWPVVFEQGLLETANSSQSHLRHYGVEGPWVVLASVLGVRGYSITTDRLWPSEPAYRDDMLLGQLVLDRIEPDGLLPIAENFWLLFGIHRPDRVLGDQG
jgi:hypothetical protein